VTPMHYVFMLHGTAQTENSDLYHLTSVRVDGQSATACAIFSLCFQVCNVFERAYSSSYYSKLQPFCVLSQMLFSVFLLLK